MTPKFLYKGGPKELLPGGGVRQTRELLRDLSQGDNLSHTDKCIAIPIGYDLCGLLQNT